MTIDLYQAALAASGSRGFYNKNVRVDGPSGPVIVRIPLHDADSVDLRIWQEQDVLAAIAPYVTHAPRLLDACASPAYQVHEFISGDVLDDIAPRGRHVPPIVLDAVVELFTQLAEVPRESLPGLPISWAQDGDTVAFARVLSDTTQGVYDAFRGEFGGLFAELGIPADPLAPARERWSTLASRPFRLVHSDVHRKNVIINGERVVFLDWELALWGDPLYELAVHFHKMAYQVDEYEAVLARWGAAMAPQLTHGWERDLQTYLAHERVKSAIVDTVRYTQLIVSGKLPTAEERELIDKLADKHAAAATVWGRPEAPDRERIDRAVRRA
ncbi:phosphotransferase [Nonomuraea sp. K274]|uniref:Phosphotransferase n=1 Tax=Nonomuraea cypriaca TaxID=1187855 RepID=A0A931EYU5_9ACTN|nr:phosphotransferase [Nonomuraea cypriaca]MBF8185571.1 phosphotransferase [Nonomuraea cypriaca]